MQSTNRSGRFPASIISVSKSEDVLLANMASFFDYGIE